MIDNKTIYELGKQYDHLSKKWKNVQDTLRVVYNVELSTNAIRKRAKRYEKSFNSKKWSGDSNTLHSKTKNSVDYSFEVPFVAENVLIISDLHLPFAKKGWLDFILRTRDKYKCETVLSIGDVLDHHALSRWVSDPDGYSGGTEIRKAVDDVQRLNKYFPDLRVCLGNHDTRHMQSAMKAGLSVRYLRHMNEILDVNWQWHYTFVQKSPYGDVGYTHGDEKGGFYATQNIAQKEARSTVSGHTHTSPSVSWYRNHHKTFFALNVGCLVDENNYAMAYGKKNAYKTITGMGAVLNNGTTPLFIRDES